MFYIKWCGIGGPVVTYVSEGLVWKAVHEMLEEVFGDNYGEKEIDEYEVVAV